MNREIKFRAWNKEMKYMSPVGQLNEMKSVLIYVPEQTDEDGNVDWNGDIVPLEKVELMQYTGLKDKNGKEIYEGDIVVFYDTTLPVEGEGVMLVCQYEAPEFVFKASNNGRYGQPDDDFDFIEIIGNIYENPELLK